jgi:hypothetical protein
MDGMRVPLLTPSESEIFARYMGLGRDQNGRALVAEQEAMLSRMRRLGYAFVDADILECWGEIAEQESSWRMDQLKKKDEAR